MDNYNCLSCGKELVRARDTKKYCNSYCRLKHYRTLSVSPKERKEILSVSNSTSKLLAKARNLQRQAESSVSQETVSVSELTYEKE